MIDFLVYTCRLVHDWHKRELEKVDTRTMEQMENDK